MELLNEKRLMKRSLSLHFGWLPILTTAMFMITLFALSPTLFLHPRFFAEEGADYFAQLRNTGLLHALTFVFNANYQLGTNLSAWLASLVPLSYAPAITTYLSLLVMLAVAYQFSIVAAQNDVPPVVTALALIAWASLPTNIEIFMTATNVQWTMAMSVLLLILTSLDILSWPVIIGFAVWTAVCGLTGVPSCVLTPFMLARGIFLRSKPHLVFAVVLTMCTLVELFVVFQGHAGGRTFRFGPRYLIDPIVLQTLVVPLLGLRIADTLGSLARHNGQVGYALMLFGLLIFVSALSAFGPGSKKRWLARSIIVIWFFTTFVYLAGSLGSAEQKPNYVSAMYGARYLDLGSVCLLLFLSLLATTRARWVVLLGLLTFIYHSAPATRAIQAAYAAGSPKWRRQLEHCKREQPCKVDTWPVGWSFTLM